MSRKSEKLPVRSSLLDDLANETPELLARLDSRPNTENENVPQLPIADITPDPNQPRKYIREDTLISLAKDISRQGVLQPVVVRPAPDWHGFLLVFGERRFRAAQIAGLKHIPAIIRRDLTEVQILELQWQENAQREDIDDIDKALHLRRYKEVAGLTWNQLAEQTHLTRRHLIRMQQIAEMPQKVRELLRERRLSASHVYHLARLPVEDQERFAEQTTTENWSVRQLDERIQAHLYPTTPTQPSKQSSIFVPIIDKLKPLLAGKVNMSEADKDTLREIIRIVNELLEGSN